MHQCCWAESVLLLDDQYEDHKEQVVESHTGIHCLLWDFTHASVLETTGVLGYWHIRCSHSNPCKQVGEDKNVIWSFTNAVCLKITFQKQNGYSCSLKMILNLVKLCFLYMHFLKTPRDNTGSAGREGCLLNSWSACPSPDLSWRDTELLVHSFEPIRPFSDHLYSV